jgi:RHS repeat-associated protein
VLSGDKMVITESGYLEVFAYNDAQTPVFFDNIELRHTSGPVLEENHYYPFGMLMDMSYMPVSVNERNFYEYGRKELQTEHNLNWGDHENRMSDYTAGRWWVVDPLAEDYYDWSPYAHTLNNPVLFIDPNGESIDWYFNLHNGQIVNVPGNKDLFKIGYIRLAGDDASIGDIKDVLTSCNYTYELAAESGIQVDTEKQYKGWAMMQIYNPENVGTILGLSFAGSATAANNSKQFLPGMGTGGKSVWSLNALERGLSIEKSLGGNLPKNFPVIDKLQNGVATSIKSVDLTAKTYNKGNGLLNTLTGYVNKLSNFTQGQRGNFTVLEGVDFTRKTLDVAIQPGRATAQQWEQIGKAMKYAKSQGIEFIIRFIH